MKAVYSIISTMLVLIVSVQTQAQWEQILGDTNVKAVYVNDTNIIIGTDNGKVYLTSDFGQSWEDLSYNLPNFVIDNIGIADSNKLVCTCGRFVFVSADWSGWTEAYQLPTGITCMAIDGPNIYVGGEIDGGIHGSTDNGNSWVDLSDNLINKYLTSIAFPRVYITLYIVSPRTTTVCIGTTDAANTLTVRSSTVRSAARSRRRSAAPPPPTSL